MFRITVDEWDANRPTWDLGSGYSLVRADKALFSVYQTLYSDADVELWYDWERRLADTTWSNDCFFLLREGVKVGGAIIQRGTLMYPFLIPPFADKFGFLSIMKAVLKAWVEPGARVFSSSTLDCDHGILLSLGFRAGCMRRMMARPTDTLDTAWPEGYTVRTPGLDDAPAIAGMFVEAFTGGVHWEHFGAMTLEESVKDAEKGLGIYIGTGSISQSTMVLGPNGDVAGACISGIDPFRPNRFSGIYDVAVAPAHRGKGLAWNMIRHALTEAHKQGSQVMTLCVTVGNPAEALYTRLGFMAGPRFTGMHLD